jgi:hypothetical protein
MTASSHFLRQVFTNKDPVSGKTKGQQAKDLLAKYGSAYLITSISFAIVSFAACYALVSAGARLSAWPLFLLPPFSYVACALHEAALCRRTLASWHWSEL